MKFVYQGKYTQKMGRMFAFGQPVEVNDRATIMVLEKDPDFKKVTDEKAEQKAEKVLIPDECPKCGKTVKRGKFMHAKYCQGK